jgi:methyltransferase
MWLPFVALLIFVPMLVETARSRRHERTLRQRGAVEPSDDIYPLMQVAYPGLFAAILIEGGRRGATWSGGGAVGLAVFGVAKLLKYAAIAALGDRWTFRVLVLPGKPLVTRGPYRWLRHPNYVAVIGELLGAALLASAPVTGVLAITLFGFLIWRRIAVEERALGGARR